MSNVVITCKYCILLNSGEYISALAIRPYLILSLEISVQKCAASVRAKLRLLNGDSPWSRLFRGADQRGLQSSGLRHKEQIYGLSPLCHGNSKRHSDHPVCKPAQASRRCMNVWLSAALTRIDVGFIGPRNMASISNLSGLSISHHHPRISCKSWILSKHANRSPMHRTPQPMPFVPTVESTNTSCTKPALCKVDVPKRKAIWPYSTFLSVLWVVPLSASAHLLARPQALKAAFTPHLHQNCFVPKQHRYLTSSIRPKCDCCCRFRLKTKKCLHGFLFRKSTTVHAPRLYEQH